jgi:nucleotide-binding universal stress UspA family protein
VFRSILCPVDFSAHSERALGYAIDLAALVGAQLTVVTVVDAFLDAASQAAGARPALSAQTQEELRALLSRVDASRTPHGRLAIAVDVGEPARKILDQARECSADLIVMGTQGLEGARRLMFGSTTEKVLREATVPVLAVPADLAPVK